jgi:hypothetical protein
VDVEGPATLATAPFSSAPVLRATLDRLLDPPGEPEVPVLWVQTLEHLIESLGGSRDAAEPFIAAWRTFYAATLLLDHLQDGDLLRDALVAQQPPAIQYHLALSMYVGAQCALAQLDPGMFGAERILRLQRFWATTVAQIAAGQYLDLTHADADQHAPPAAVLDTYARIAAHKTGATFALAFGGAAILVSADEALVQPLEQLGMIYGMLLQYYDDLIDHDQQVGQPTALTLFRALLRDCPPAQGDGDAQAVLFWQSIYNSYAQACQPLLAQLPPPTQAIIEALWKRTFARDSLVSSVAS